jgi:SAM-dependent methyltransferase
MQFARPHVAGCIDTTFLSMLRCVRCDSPQQTLRQQAPDKIRCTACSTHYDVISPGIPRLMRSNELAPAMSEHERHWDELPPQDYTSVLSENDIVLRAIDSIHLGHAHGVVLEVGAGSGRFLKKLEDVSAVREMVGLDLSLGMLRRAAADGFRRLVNSPAENLPFHAHQFDTVVSAFSSLKYADRSKAFPEIFRVLRPGGHFTFDLLNYWPHIIDQAWQRHLSHGHWPPRAFRSEYLNAFNMRSARQETALLRRSGFEVLQLKSPWYAPFLRGRLRDLGYWPGYWGSRIGYCTVFVCRKLQ